LRGHRRKLKKIEVKISGIGGQGVILAGQILGKAAIYDGKNAAQTQSYGAEARGSVAESEVIISDGKIGFPAVRKCDVLIVMSQEALERHLKALKEDGVLIVDSTYVKKIPETKAKVFKIPATESAEKAFGAKTYANMLILGALTKVANIVSGKAMGKAIEDTTAEKDADVNRQAYKKGQELMKKEQETAGT
jgi:2-oxoglutarate ferredoxin oxidoreductase subunit gamma